MQVGARNSFNGARPKGVRLGVALPAILAVIGALAWSANDRKRVEEESANFAIGYQPPSGWKKLEHGPQTLFLYREPKTRLLLRGAVNQVVSEVNPTPLMHTDSLASYYIDRTHENMPGWSATMMGTVDANGTRFRIIRRERRNKAVVTAFAVRGNTTLLVSLSANGDEVSAIDPALPGFYDFLAQMSMKKTDLSNL